MCKHITADLRVGFITYCLQPAFSSPPLINSAKNGFSFWLILQEGREAESISSFWGGGGAGCSPSEGDSSVLQLWKQPQVGRAGPCLDFGQLGESGSLFTMDQRGMLAEVLGSCGTVWISALLFPQPAGWREAAGGRDVRKTCSLPTASLCTAIIHAGDPMLGDMGSGRGNV